MSLPSLLSNAKFRQSEIHQKCFIEAWNTIKKYSFDSSICGNLVKLILNAKDLCPLPNFTREEISFLYSQAYDFDYLKNVTELQEVSLQVNLNFFLILNIN